MLGSRGQLAEGRQVQPEVVGRSSMSRSGDQRSVGDLGLPHLAVRAAVVALAYELTARYSVIVQDLDAFGVGYWPPAGVLVGALLVSPRWMWPGILTAVVGMRFGLNVLEGTAVEVASAWAVAKLVTASATASLILRVDAAGLDTPSRVVAFGAAAFVGSALGALPGSIGVAAAGAQLPVTETALHWALGDGVGITTMAPVVLALTGKLSWPHRRPVEALMSIVAILVLVAGLFVFGQGHLTDHATFLVVLPLLWVGLRAGNAGSAVAVGLVAQVVTIATGGGYGPFSPDSTGLLGSWVLVTSFVTTAGLATMLLAARTLQLKEEHERVMDRDELLAVVSHELRTPLTPIVGFAEAMIDRHRDLPDDLRTGLEAIHRNGRHLTGLIDNVLLLSRFRADDATPRSARFEVGELVRRTAEVGDGADDGSITVELDIEPDCIVMADPVHVGQIMTNLLDNARKYGRPPVSVRVHRADTFVQVEVVDSGDGVPRWFVPHLFDPFVQPSSGDGRVDVGLGIGLAVCRTLAVANGGDLAYEPPDGGGARFVLELPTA